MHDNLMGLGGILTVNAQQRIEAPSLDRAFYQDHQIAANRVAIERIKGQYYNEIITAAAVTSLPVNLIAAFIFVESSGKNVVRSSGNSPTGLMQIAPSTATIVIMNEFKGGRMNSGKKQLLENLLGKAKVACIAQHKWQNHKIKCSPTGVVITARDLSKPAVNVAIGALYLAWLIDQHTEAGTVRLDKVIVRYNAGHNYKPPVGGTANEMFNFALQKGGKESGNYITKLVGRNGLIEMLT